MFPGNRWTGAQYDNGAANGAGNLTGVSGLAFGYDAENRQTSAMGGLTAASYSYDGDGRRVQKVTCPAGTLPCTAASTGATVTTYVYDVSGKLAAEYSTNPGTPQCTTCYLTADQLGSTRMMTDGTTGAVVGLHDYLPFGEEIPDGMGGRGALYGLPSPNQKFTGKERDSETGLDYFGARYFSSAQGRFTSPDKGPYPWNDPQTLNRYAYTRNNPLKYVDPTGLYFVVPAGNEGIRHEISTLLRSPSGRALVERIAEDPRPTFISSGRLHFERGDGRIRITKGTTTAIPGSSGKISGTDVVVDKINAALQVALTGSGNVNTLSLKALVHELFHVDDINHAATTLAAVAAGVQGDAGGAGGGTENGTAEQRALAVLAELGAAANSYTPDADADSEANAILEHGAEMNWKGVAQGIGMAFSGGTRMVFHSHIDEAQKSQCAQGNPAACN